MKGIAFRRKNMYSEARKWIKRYADLSWIENVSEKGRLEVDYYRNISIMNGYVIDLLEGEINVLPVYVDCLRRLEKEEILPGLTTILESAIHFNYAVDWIINEFKDQVTVRNADDTKESIRFYIDYIYLLAVYHYKQDRFSDAINLILEVLGLCNKLEDGAGFKKSVAFYEVVRRNATVSQQERYEEIMKTIMGRVLWEDEENLVNDSRIVVD